MADELPQSPALSEAGPESINEYMSRSPAGMSEQDFDKVIEYYRAMRPKFAAAEAAGRSKPAKAVAGAAAGLVSSAKLGDMGL